MASAARLPELLLLLSLFITTTAGAAGGIRCGSAPAVAQLVNPPRNVSVNLHCPASSNRCVPRNVSSPRNGFPFACEVNSTTTPGSTAVCSFGAPLPLAATTATAAAAAAAASTGANAATNASGSKRNVLMIGDSVSNGYFLEGTFPHNVPDMLVDVAVAQHAPFSPGSGGAGSVAHGLDCLDVYLHTAAGDPARYDLVTFNSGLHDLDNTTAALAAYERRLAALADGLLARATTANGNGGGNGNASARLLYLMTTPMMPGCCGGGPLIPSSEGAPVPKCKAGDAAVYACDGVVQRLNAAAARVMAARRIATLDLHAVVTDVCAPTAPHRYVNCSLCRMAPCSFHYNPHGYDTISAPIAAAVRSMLAALG